jgi:Ca-activated chloride channel homolog
MKIFAKRLAPNNRKAAILTLFIFLLPVLLIMLGFSVDLAYMHLVKTELRLASDNAARVAADSLSRYEDERDAQEAGVKVAKQFTVAGSPLRLRSDDFDFGRATADEHGVYTFNPDGSPLNAVRVNAVRNAGSIDGSVPLFFGRLIGNKSFSPEVTAIASFINVDICLVLDRSTSMKFKVDSTEMGMSLSDRRFCKPPSGSSRWGALDKAVRVFHDELRRNSAEEQVSIITFGSDLDFVHPGLCGRLPSATLDIPLTTNIDAADGTMNTLSNSVWNGNTEIAAGIDLAVTELASPRSRRFADRVMIVLTDGFPTAGDAIAAATQAAAQRITVYAITFGPDGDQSYMKKVAAAGHGEHAHAATEKELKEIFKRFAAKATILIQ